MLSTFFPPRSVTPKIREFFIDCVKNNNVNALKRFFRLASKDMTKLHRDHKKNLGRDFHTVTDDDGRSLLHIASDMRHFDMIQFLVQAGHSLYWGGRLAVVPCWQAILSDDVDVIKCFIQ